MYPLHFAVIYLVAGLATWGALAWVARDSGFTIASVVVCVAMWPVLLGILTLDALKYYFGKKKSGRRGGRSDV